ncbi:hypothetical protein DD237_001284 [Peronospora effusa]|uniref:Uncharacterized protein n=1 Tax=Peronospora effusa TaxID=542832 RepID=A0A425CHW1_9STRA|nr:hypothetical protein DD237_001284 [Peronospora effusa]
MERALRMYSSSQLSILPAVTAAEAAEVPTQTIEGMTPEVIEVSIDITHALITVIKSDLEEDILVATTSFVDEIGVEISTLRQCLAAFTQRHTATEPLTVSARAFSKHYAQSSNGWWGELKGNVLPKNCMCREESP